MTVFDHCFEILIGHEGGYVNDPQDPGGETKFGISKRAFPHLDIANLTIDAAKEIYRSEYWDKVKGDDLPAPMALAVFDCAVNCGATQGARWLQQALDVRVDGNIGPVTVQAARAANAGATVAELLALRNLHNTYLPTWPRFGLGWSRRLFKLAHQAAEM